MNNRPVLQIIRNAVSRVSYVITSFLLISFFMLIAFFALTLLCKLFSPIENIVYFLTEDLYTKVFGEEVWPFALVWFVIIPSVLTAYTLVHESKSEKKNKQSPKETASSTSETTSPTSDVLDVLERYKEIKSSNNINITERIRRCEEVLTEYEWYCGHRENDFSYANIGAIWHAVCECDIPYIGNRYEHDMMSNICLKIQEEKFNSNTY